MQVNTVCIIFLNNVLTFRIDFSGNRKVRMSILCDGMYGTVFLLFSRWMLKNRNKKH